MTKYAPVDIALPTDPGPLLVMLGHPSRLPYDEWTMLDPDFDDLPQNLLHPAELDDQL